MCCDSRRRLDGRLSHCTVWVLRATSWGSNAPLSRVKGEALTLKAGVLGCGELVGWCKPPSVTEDFRYRYVIMRGPGGAHPVTGKPSEGAKQFNACLKVLNSSMHAWTGRALACWGVEEAIHTTGRDTTLLSSVHCSILSSRFSHFCISSATALSLQLCRATRSLQHRSQPLGFLLRLLSSCGQSLQRSLPFFQFCVRLLQRPP